MIRALLCLLCSSGAATEQAQMRQLLIAAALVAVWGSTGRVGGAGIWFSCVGNEEVVDIDSKRPHPI